MLVVYHVVVVLGALAVLAGVSAADSGDEAGGRILKAAVEWGFGYCFVQSFIKVGRFWFGG